MSERKRFLYSGLALLGGLLVIRNLYVILFQLPDEVQQGPIYRIIYFHVPAAWVAFLLFFVGLVAGLLYLVKKDFRYDNLAVAATEVGLVLATVNLLTGSIWARVIWGIWWTWDPRLTSMFVCWLLYAGYLLLRRMIEEPSQRARISAIYSAFAFIDIPIVFFSIAWWRTQHPQPVVWGGGSMDPAMKSMLFFNVIPLLMIAVSLVAFRSEHERVYRELEAVRREAYSRIG